MTLSGHPSRVAVLVIDMANVVGSVPDGWWRDRAAAAHPLLAGLVPLSGRTVTGPDGDPLRLGRVVAVLEGGANRVTWPPDREPGPHDGGGSDDGTGQDLTVIRADGSGDDAIAALVADLVAAGDRVLAVTADRGLRARLPAEVATIGPGWLNTLLGRGARPGVARPRWSRLTPSGCR